MNLYRSWWHRKCFLSFVGTCLIVSAKLDPMFLALFVITSFINYQEDPSLMVTDPCGWHECTVIVHHNPLPPLSSWPALSQVSLETERKHPVRVRGVWRTHTERVSGLFLSRLAMLPGVGRTGMPRMVLRVPLSSVLCQWNCEQYDYNLRAPGYKWSSVTDCRLIVLVSCDDANIVSDSVMAWRLSPAMDRALHRRRLGSLVTCLTIISVGFIMVTDLRFYLDMVTPKTSTGEKHKAYKHDLCPILLFIFQLN